MAKPLLIYPNTFVTLKYANFFIWEFAIKSLMNYFDTSYPWWNRDRTIAKMLKFLSSATLDPNKPPHPI